MVLAWEASQRGWWRHGEGSLMRGARSKLADGLLRRGGWGVLGGMARGMGEAWARA